MSSRNHLPQFTRKTPTFDQKVKQVVDTVGVQPRGVPSVDLTTRVAALEGTVSSGGTGPVAASRITGTISIANLPPTALERLVIVADDAARLALTAGTVQNGDTVKVTTSGKMWFVVNDALLGTGSAASAFEEYTVGTAASVPWAGITGKPSAFPPEAHTQDWSTITGRPSTFPPSAHTHAMSDITGLGSGLASLTADQTFTAENRFFYTGANTDKVWLSRVDSGPPELFNAWSYRSPLAVSMRSDVDVSTKSGNTDDGIAKFYYEVHGSTPAVWNGDNTAVAATGGIWPGVQIDMHKYKNSSAHCITASGVLHECDPNNGYPGYNEAGLYQGSMFNAGSYYGLLEGIGLQIYDTHDPLGEGLVAYRANARATAMTGMVLNLHKYSSTFDPGKYNTNGIIINSVGDYAIHRGINLSGGMYIGVDFREGNYLTSAVLMKEDQSIYWSYSGGGNKDMSIRMSPSGALQVRSHGFHADASLKVQDYYGVTKFQVAIMSSDPVYMMFDGALKQVRQGNPDSAGTGCRILYVPN